MSPQTRHQLVLASCTNLANLHQHPPLVLGAFTNLGHLAAWVVGLAVAQVATRAQQATVRR